jgi:pimeloyl-ACP methyl ester carboxylesterase
MNAIEFNSKGVRIRGDHYAPDSDTLATAAGSPCVVMAHGLSMTRDGGLAPFAEAFAAIGCHVVVFDYRYFGDSGGEPRELVAVRRQLKDWRAAVDFARRLEGVDPDRIALWGTSYSGGHVVEIASRDPRIAAVISQVPNLDGLATLGFLIRHEPARRLRWLSGVIVRDALRGLLRREPLYVKSIGREGEQAAYVSNESYEQVQQIAGPNFRNRFAPRDFLRPPPYRPGKRIEKLACRIMLVGAENDTLTPAEPVKKAAARLGSRCEFVSYPIGHFGAYVEPTLSDSLVRQVAFLTEELAPS